VAYYVSTHAVSIGSAIRQSVDFKVTIYTITEPDNIRIYIQTRAAAVRACSSMTAGLAPASSCCHCNCQRDMPYICSAALQLSRSLQLATGLQSLPAGRQLKHQFHPGSRCWSQKCTQSVCCCLQHTARVQPSPVTGEPISNESLCHLGTHALCSHQNAPVGDEAKNLLSSWPSSTSTP
jgi:hypothetical protein